MSRRDYHDWRYYLGDIGWHLVDRKGVPEVGGLFIDIRGNRWRVYAVEQRRGVRNARLTPENPLGGPLPCPRCGGHRLHYANCPDQGAGVYSVDSLTIDGKLAERT